MDPSVSTRNINELIAVHPPPPPTTFVSVCLSVSVKKKRKRIYVYEKSDVLVSNN